ncbi:Spermidine synthase [Thioalkalivibrio nitratireducens DSM 14787]|uniref:Spermidine synthase n=1 Tax=Thioalkalivibrio nitratireducens (strain DSM 14787 / UNIQEM 213 / ALEN2) TaxID=1255043 RepID=L0E1X6_THIND|nr:fused MFS/spermidine synthase [Thioalkalivibrio nitratireducens]AGA35210.1 Spermidine synthase [Thioalkalivibrio nitratireducens DSM 14787]
MATGFVYTRSGIDLTASPVRVDASHGETLVALREGHAAHAAVIEREDGLSIRANNYYTLGSTHAAIAERNQTLIPLLVHPPPETVFFLGMGSGITAGAALLLPVERVVVCELLGEVVDLARDRFQPWVNGLFDDSRVTIYAEDGRHCLARSPERFDAIIADLFTPWKAGTGNLYTQDHYRLAAERLKPGGMYVQWIPLYQVSMQELAIIGTTMASVFPELTLWRGDLYPSRSIVALLGRNTAEPLDPEVLVRNARRLLGEYEGADEYYEALGLLFYAGNPEESRFFAEALINTDDRPLIEYLAPRTHRAVLTGAAQWGVGVARDRLCWALFDALPPERDPYLRALDERQLRHVEAGLRYALYQGIRVRGTRAEARAVWLGFLEVVTPATRSPDSPAGQAGFGASGFGSGERN